MNFPRSAALAALLFVAAYAPATATTVRGDTTATVVWISTPKAAPKPIQAVMTNRNRSFIPSLAVIPIGSSVRFPNDDPFEHSIYSTSPADPFDIGFYGTGPGKVVAFPNPGVIDVHCHIHASMHATIIVADGPYALVSGGTFVLDNVAPGRHTLHSWDLQNGERTRDVEIPASGEITIDTRL